MKAAGVVRRNWIISLLLLILLSSAGVGTAETCGSAPLFSASPLDLGHIMYIRTLGGLNPPGHVFPTDHIYFYIQQDTSGTPYEVPFYAPGDMTVTTIYASQHVRAGYTDFSLDLRPCEDVTVVFGHITSLAIAVFGDTTSFQDWELSHEYETGGELYRRWRKSVSIQVAAGQTLGTTGGRYGQFALDLGVYDDRTPAVNVANPDRWMRSSVLYARCPFEYYMPGPILDELVSLVDRKDSPDDSLKCGAVFLDISGTAQGNWFAFGVSSTYPEDPHLALVYSNTNSAVAVISVGTSIPGLSSGRYEFRPRAGGLVNRAFHDITPDGKIYGFDTDRHTGIIIVSMPDEETLWIEALSTSSTNSGNWSFTSRKAIFKR